MKLLLDTHILVWVLQDAKTLKPKTRRLIDAADSVHVSSVVLWEVAIKVALGKLKIDLDRLDTMLLTMAFEPLPISWQHARALRSLPPLHRDPFDRMLIAQAISEPLHLLTSDAALAAYGPQVTLV